jgi:hypothetical protein
MFKVLVLLILLTYAPIAWGEDLYLLEPSKLTMEYYKVANNRDEYLAINDQGSTKYGDSDETWRYGSAVKFNLDLIRFGDYGLYWDNNVHMSATQCCVRHVGWEFEAGARASKHLDFFYYHHSQHILDLERESRRYPLVNRYGVRFVFIDRGRK